ncbi:bifunctional DNA-formamidopyrimidine glycosylase/DNA-(apurinic or apyrimidinic site) lyase [Geomonas sp. Red69]|uniref:Formamidopyrimidine-DNA glycosylase n=1 Tax=Geomonas diazotrophica TaxID=2843197 RepID=A0ABX8JNR6_9BACT|nr:MULTISPECIES: bifunctional DNA-formamidopyrimidine glycosylase/DNA-(apurinic or apyrimidinic site) lyase [Geomonas]MBU5637520.1 bifunctional DNA-formamidopyrimidine glycosylase/DNA-(apurinic or apyrimidinic site) lyase [Geomonas diazotrophica]QWV99358.1 bifunctional DNA-formamidopyrimidine glycosylase/DNA-(apurinic or apyrimidinic site) lyase [Geomonas nitrogeniifigens]
MPELPEVEVTRLGIKDHLTLARIASVELYIPKLRNMVPEGLSQLLAGQTVRSVERRGKYLILDCGAGSLLLHLGMTGHLRLVPASAAPGPHDHFDLRLDSGIVLRLNDPRRFGSIHFAGSNPLQHQLLRKIGPEPLTDAFAPEYLYRLSRGRKVALQRFLMDSAVVAGIGNIYAAESLFRCRLHPDTPAGELSSADCAALVAAIKETLATAIATGRSTMDFLKTEERLAYFPQQLYVYGRAGLPCRECGTPVRRGRLGNRSTFFCAECQPEHRSPR